MKLDKMTIMGAEDSQDHLKKKTVPVLQVTEFWSLNSVAYAQE